MDKKANKKAFKISHKINIIVLVDANFKMVSWIGLSVTIISTIVEN
jgi:hypothetical protein